MHSANKHVGRHRDHLPLSFINQTTQVFNLLQPFWQYFGHQFGIIMHLHAIYTHLSVFYDRSNRFTAHTNMGEDTKPTYLCQLLT